MKPSPYVHQLGVSQRWVIAKLKADGTYVAPFIDAQPGGVHSYATRSLLALASKTRVYLSRSGALRAAKRLYGEG
jgi:hypothetical protein